MRSRTYSLLLCTLLLALSCGDGGRPSDPANARLYDACVAGNGKSCSDLATNYNSGTGVEHSARRTRIFLKRGCEVKDAWACAELGDIYRMGRDVRSDEAEATTYYARACDFGSAVGCQNLAVRYSKGIIVKKDPARATSLYERACELEDLRSCVTVGLRYHNGTGVPRDDARAAKLFMIACDGGAFDGCGQRAWLYENGFGQKDMRKALLLYHKGCDGHHADSCARLGFLYLLGRDVSKSDQTAAQYFQQACDFGEGGACIMLAEQSILGRGVPRSESKARALLQLSCNRDKGLACQVLRPQEKTYEPRLDRTLSAWKKMTAAIRKLRPPTSAQQMYNDLSDCDTAIARIDPSWVDLELSNHMRSWTQWTSKMERLMRDGRLNPSDFEVLGTLVGAIGDNDSGERMQRDEAVGRFVDQIVSDVATQNAEAEIVEEAQGLALEHQILRVRLELRYGVAFDVPQLGAY